MRDLSEFNVTYTMNDLSYAGKIAAYAMCYGASKTKVIEAIRQLVDDPCDDCSHWAGEM